MSSSLSKHLHCLDWAANPNCLHLSNTCLAMFDAFSSFNRFGFYSQTLGLAWVFYMWVRLCILSGR